MGLWSCIEGWIDFDIDSVDNRTEFQKSDGTKRYVDSDVYQSEADIKRLVNGICIKHNIIMQKDVPYFTKSLIYGADPNNSIAEDVLQYITTDRQNFGSDASLKHSIFIVHNHNDSCNEYRVFEDGDVEDHTYHFRHPTQFRFNFRSVNRYWTIDQHWSWFKMFLRELKACKYIPIAYNLDINGYPEDRNKPWVNINATKTRLNYKKITDYRKKE